jgi:hypothetical protein
MMGGIILALIEGVSTVVTSVSMRRQYQMMEEMQKAELERLKNQMRRSGSGSQDPWAVDYNEQVAKQGRPQEETLIDKAKSFSF